MKPILFNTEMVRAILDCRKTVTRRMVKTQPKYAAMTAAGIMVSDKPITIENGLVSTECGAVTTWDKMPYRPGDILYVRETFQIDYLSNIPGSGRIHYKADDTYRDFTFAPERYEMMRRAQLKSGWRPNENMPREAARIFLRVKDVRVERLQEIDGYGILAEGIDNGSSNPSMGKRWENMQRIAFQGLWDSTFKSPVDRALYGWEANPWVFVISFEWISRKEAEHGGVLGKRSTDARIGGSIDDVM